MIGAAGLLGLGAGLGMWLVFGWSLGAPVPDGPEADNATPERLDNASLPSRWRIDRSRVVRAAVAGLLVLAASGWPIAACAAAMLGWFSRELLGTRAERDRALGRTEAIASWTEMLRDTISAAHGLEAAISTTAPIAPVAIRSEVEQLARALRRLPLAEALRRFAVDLAHPIGDLVVASLTVAANGAVRDLADLLGLLADSARDEAAMQLKVEASRARMRTAVRVITSVTVVTAVGLVALNPSYVSIYGTAVGQVVLLAIAAAWGTALWWLAQMSRFRQPERFLLSTVAGQVAS